MTKCAVCGEAGLTVSFDSPNGATPPLCIACVRKYAAQAPSRRGEWNERRQAIVAYMRAHPEKTLAAIGEAFLVSRERVRQIAKREGYQHPRHTTPFTAIPIPCKVDGCPALIKKPAHYCAAHQGYHRGRLPAQGKMVSCGSCGHEFFAKGREVRHHERPHKLRKALRSDLYFCDKVCMGVWVADHGGYGYRPRPICRCLQCGKEEARHGTTKVGGRNKPWPFCSRDCQYAWVAIHGRVKAQPIIVGYSDLRTRPVEVKP